MAQNGVSHSDNMTLVIADATDIEPESCLGPESPVVDAIRFCLCTARYWLRRNEPVARQGNVEGVHRMRTVARRLRSELHLYRDLSEGDWAEQLDRALKWLGQSLGAARDGDVLRDRLREAAGALAMDLGPLFTRLAERHAAASAELQQALESERFPFLLEQLAAAAEQPSVASDAWEPCGRVLPALVRKSWKRLRSAARALDLSDPDEVYHEVRKRAKRARHSAESVALALDADAANDASRFARHAKVVQDVLGEHQDATVACNQIRQIAAECGADGPFNLALGRLLERQAIAAHAARTEFFKVWQKLDRSKNVHWMKD
jgi:CHAD domain-containing protein